MDENKKSESIHFRANPDDQDAVETIKKAYGLTTNAAAVRLAVRMLVAYHKLTLERLLVMAGIPTPATAFGGGFDLVAAAKIEEGANDEQ